MKHVLGILMSFGLLAPRSTLAQPPHVTGDWMPQAFERSISLGMPVGFIVGAERPDEPTILVPEASVYLPMGDHFAASANLGLALLSGNDRTESALTNLVLAGHFVTQATNYHFRAGLGVALPTSPDDDLTDAITVVSAVIPRGLWDLWRGLPRTYTVMAPVRFDYQTGNIALATEGAVALYLPNTDADPQVGMQAAVELYTPLPYVEFGGRLQFASLLDSDIDLTQVGASPFIRLRAETLRIKLAAYIFFDEPLGFAQSAGTVVGVDLGIGFVF